MSKKLLMNCKTKQKKYIDLTPLEISQQEKDRVESQQREQEICIFEMKEKKIRDELRAFAISRLEAKNNWP